MFSTTPKAVYDRLFTILDESVTLNYFNTRQKGFFPRSENLLAPTLYPWLFTEIGGFSEIGIYRYPRNWTYELTIPIVYMTFADRGDVVDMVSSDNGNANKGVIDMTADIGEVVWAYKTDFGVAGVVDWNIVRVGTPNILSVQRLLMSEYVRGLQMDLVFQIQKVD